MSGRRSNNNSSSTIVLLIVKIIAVYVLCLILIHVVDNNFITFIINAIFIYSCYAMTKTAIQEQRNGLMGEVLNYYGLDNIDYLLKSYDASITVKSRQTLDNYDEIKFIKEYDCFGVVKDVVKVKTGIRRKIESILSGNEFTQRLHYRYVAKKLRSKLLLTDGYRIRISYITTAGNNRGEKLIIIDDSDVKWIEKHPELLMTKGEYNKMLKEQEKKELDNKKHHYYDIVNSIIGFVNDSKDALIVKSRIKELDELIQQLFDRTINSIQRIKQLDSDEWGMIENFITNIDEQIRKIVNEDTKISNYYKSDEFARIKRTCISLNLSRKDFNEYIEEKAQSISRLFGTRIVRDETQNEDIYNYVRSYKKSITPFTAEVSSTVFSSAENNPIDYIVKYFYPSKSLYIEQIQKLKTLIEELETLKEAKVIIDEYKKDYEQYIQSVPDYILKSDEDGFYSRLGLAIINESVLTIQYRFTYTSAGGMAQRSFTIPMNEENIIELITNLENKLSMEALTREQRAFMTVKLRSFIKERDNYTCCLCGNSIFKEPNLLLEVDHIIPISKGGLTKEDNLQTLCWKCNRSKASKIYL